VRAAKGIDRPAGRGGSACCVIVDKLACVTEVIGKGVEEGGARRGTKEQKVAATQPIVERVQPDLFQ